LKGKRRRLRDRRSVRLERADHLIVPGGNLGNSSALGRIPRDARTRTGGTGAAHFSDSGAGANPLVRSFVNNHGAALEPVEAHTRATAIRIGNPARGARQLG